MVRPNFGPQAQRQAYFLLNALLSYANDELNDHPWLKIEYAWQSKNRLIIKTTVKNLQVLVDSVFSGNKITKEQIKESLKRYRDFLGILEDHRTKTQGSENWHFTLNLWFGRQEKMANLQRFDQEWEQRRQEKLKPVVKRSAQVSFGSELTPATLEIDQIVQLVRQAVYKRIQARCSVMRVLDMCQPVRLEAIYTAVNTYESIAGKQRHKITDLLKNFSVENYTHLEIFHKKRISGVMAVEQYSKLMIFGKLGSGKTTFLKWLAIQCNNGHFWENLVPIFISAKVYAETKGKPDLLSYIHNQWSESHVLLSHTEKLLQQGRALILFDGLDEIREADYHRVLQDISEFSLQFHQCRFVLTCRLAAAREYLFEQFTEVEIADFNEQQIVEFVTQWFTIKNNSIKASSFLNQLQSNQPIRDLATNPLLLTLLCLVFEDYQAFPSNRSELYQEGLNILLNTWDMNRNIDRNYLPESHLYYQLSLQHKESLLSQIAFTTFLRGDYFFKPQDIKQCVINFFATALNFENHPELKKINIQSILKMIELQHGLLIERAKDIYSFSHLSFHEYFTSKKLVSSGDTQLIESLNILVDHITEPEWREVFLLSVNMLPTADNLLLLMKSKIDELLSSDSELQTFLRWLQEKALFEVSQGRKFSATTIRAYVSFLSLDYVNIQANAFAIASAHNQTAELDRRIINMDDINDSEQALSLAITTAHDCDRAIAIAFAIANSMETALSKSINRITSLVMVIDKAINLISNLERKQSLQNIKKQLPDSRETISVLEQWWNSYGYDWINQLKENQIFYNNFTKSWSFSQHQIELLDKYYRANRLLVDCMISGCVITPALRAEIDATLLLSIEDIQQYKKCQNPL